MRQVVLGKSGLKVSAVGFGGIPIMRVSEDEAVRAVRRALDLGVNFIDTAAGYGDSQRKIGKAIEGRRDGLVIATKSGRTTAPDMLADIDRARAEMGVDCIDLYQLHNISADGWKKVAAPGGAMEGLLEAREKGWIGHIGYTAHSADVAIELVAEEALETVQFPFNLVTCEPAERLIPKAREADLGFIVMKPMCGGLYGDAELAFKFLNGYPDLVAIPGIERPEEIEQIVEIVESGAVLEGAEMARAEKVAADLGKQFCRRCGYCQPCPEGVPIVMAMIFESLHKRMPPDGLAGSARGLVEKTPHCVECGECESKCPYDLPIIETIKRAAALAREMLGE